MHEDIIHCLQGIWAREHSGTLLLLSPASTGAQHEPLSLSEPPIELDHDPMSPSTPFERVSGPPGAGDRGQPSEELICQSRSLRRKEGAALSLHLIPPHQSWGVHGY
jgi:hypothetical protein